MRYTVRMSEDAAPREHEFTEQENQDLVGFARQATVWGALGILAGMACALAPVFSRQGVRASWAYLPIGGVQLGLGIAFVLAGRRFHAAVTTKGRDVENVLDGLSFLSSALFAQIVILGVGSAAAVAGLFLGAR